MALTLGAAGLLCHYQALQRQTLIEVGNDQHRLSAVSLISRAAAVSEMTFVDLLPRAQDSTPVLRGIQRSFSPAGVVLISASVSVQPPSTSVLGKQRFVLTAKGSYSAIKSALADLLGQLPNAALLNLALHAPAAGTDLEGQVELLVLSQPLPASRTASAP